MRRGNIREASQFFYAVSAPGFLFALFPGLICYHEKWDLEEGISLGGKCYLISWNKVAHATDDMGIVFIFLAPHILHLRKDFAGPREATFRCAPTFTL